MDPSEIAGKAGRLVMAGDGDATRTCHLDLSVEEHNERTRAKARLARIGDELAIARALSDWPTSCP